MYPKWVSNEKKYDRAIIELRKEGKSNPSDEVVKLRYVSYGGLVLGDNKTALGVPEEVLAVGMEGIKLNGLLKIADHLGVDVKGLKKDEIVSTLQKFLDEDKHEKPESKTADGIVPSTPF